MQPIETFRASELVVPDYNPRDQRAKDPELAELAKSIQKRGILQPLLLHRNGKRVEVLAGSRRLRAALSISKDYEVPGRVLDVGTVAAKAIALEENLQREDLDPLEEAEAIQRLAEEMPIADVAAAVGKSPVYCARRANLVKLSTRWRAELGKPDQGKAEGYTPAHLELVALLPEKVQNELLSARDWRGRQGRDIRRLREIVADETRLISKAPWKPGDDALVPAAGACTDCPRNTANADADLFGDIDGRARGKASEARCTDRACWTRKLQAHRTAKLDRAYAEHGSALRLVKEYGPRGDADVGPDLSKHPGAKKPVDRYSLSPARKGADGAFPVFVVSGTGAGSVRWCKTNRRGSAVSSKPKPAGAGKKVGELTPAEARARLKASRDRLAKRRELWIVEQVLEELDETCLKAWELAEAVASDGKRRRKRRRTSGRGAVVQAANAKSRKKGELAERPRAVAPDDLVQVLFAAHALGVDRGLERDALTVEELERGAVTVLRAKQSVWSDALHGAASSLRPKPHHDAAHRERTKLALWVWRGLLLQSRDLVEAAKAEIPEPASWGALRARTKKAPAGSARKAARKSKSKARAAATKKPKTKRTQKKKAAPRKRKAKAASR